MKVGTSWHHCLRFHVQLSFFLFQVSTKSYGARFSLRSNTHSGILLIIIPWHILYFRKTSVFLFPLFWVHARVCVCVCLSASVFLSLCFLRWLALVWEAFLRCYLRIWLPCVNPPSGHCAPVWKRLSLGNDRATSRRLLPFTRVSETSTPGGMLRRGPRK